MSPFIVIMGVSGSGKTVVGRSLARRLNCPFFEGDDYHSPENVAKMARGIPLNDQDRRPWLEALHGLIGRYLSQDKPAVVACSALKKEYRRILSAGNPGLAFVYLKGEYDLIWKRILAREDHYMKAGMLQSQFDELEEPSPEEALWIDVNRPPDVIVDIIIEHLATV